MTSNEAPGADAAVTSRPTGVVAVPHTPGPPVLELARVTKSYGTGTAGVEILHGIDLAVGKGEFLGIVGPSGSGKSTLLNLMGMLDRPTSGQVRIVGYDTSRLSDGQVAAVRATRLGFVFQQFFLLDRRTALDNVADGLLYSGVRRPERRARAEVALRRVGLGHRLEHMPSQLSGGECQRVAIARALVHEPDIVLADEPTGNLDSVAGATVLQILEDLHRDGVTIAMITHDRGLVERFSRTVTIRDGLIEEGSAA